MVRSLVYYAYKALHGEDVMLQLWQRSVESNEENQLNLDSADRVMSVSVIKAQLDEYLVGRYSPFRYQLWLYYYYSFCKEEPNRPDLFTFLECIFDYNFTIDFVSHCPNLDETDDNQVDDQAIVQEREEMAFSSDRSNFILCPFLLSDAKGSRRKSTD